MLNRLGNIFSIMRLRWQFSLVIIGIISIMGGVVFILIQSTLTKVLVSEIEEHGILLSRNIAANISDPLLVGNIIKIQFLINEVKEREKEVSYVYIHNKKGDVIAHTFEKGFPRQLPKKISSQREMTYLVRSYETEKGLIRDIASPILNWDVGAVHVGLSLSGIELAVSQMNRTLLIIILMVSILGITAAFILSSLIVNPLEELEKFAKEIGEGNLDLVILIKGKNEISSLSGSINNMAHLLKLDFAKRKKAEMALKSSEAELEAIIENSGIGITVSDLNGKVLRTNPAHFKMFGYSTSELSTMSFSDFIHPDDVEKHLGTYREMLSGKHDHFIIQKRFIHKKGSVVWARVTISLARNNNNEPLFVIGIVEDITERKQAEDEKEQLISELQLAVKEIKTLRGIVPICSYCKQIRDDEGFWSQVEEYVTQHTEAEFSHGICPDCAKKYHPDVFGDE